jgi:endonuclease YncB( thermonuclease family)
MFEKEDWNSVRIYELIPSMIPAMVSRRSAVPRLALALYLAPPAFVPQAASPAFGAEQLRGPVSAEVVRVIDGDTIEVSAQIWLGLRVSSNVRIRGIDTPELHSTCAGEKAMASDARDRLAKIAGDSIRLANISQDKFGGRVDADVTNADDVDLKAAMLASGLAHPYDGRGARADWCPVASVR